MCGHRASGSGHAHGCGQRGQHGHHGCRCDCGREAWCHCSCCGGTGHGGHQHGGCGCDAERHEGCGHPHQGSHAADCCGGRGRERHGGTGHGRGVEPFQRRFLSREERASELEGFLGELRTEAEAGAEYLEALRAEIETLEAQLEALRGT